MSTRRPADNQMKLLAMLRAGTRIEEACDKLGIDPSTWRTWKQRYPEFAEAASQAKEIGRRAREEVGQLANVLDLTEYEGRKPPGIVRFREEFIGRPTPWHQQLVVDAWEDATNQYVICLMPPEAGKDTLAGDIVLRESADRDIRTAWVMESANFSARRLSRLERYLWDSRAYVAPRGPGCSAPTKTMFEEFGPFKWSKGMVYPDGEKVAQPKWTQNELYFLGRDNEADPNLWATGIDGAMYGARIDRGVLSDIFTQENQASPTIREGQLSWLFGTFFSRLGDEGRALFLGTRVGEWDNWGRLIDKLVGDAPPIHEDRFVTKYANGVCVIVVPAIITDDDGSERSFWPERFDLDSYLVRGSHKVPLEGLDGEAIKEYGRKGYRTVTGLRGLQERLGPQFDTMYQQNPAASGGGDFPLELLNRCDDYTRSYGMWKPGSTLELGIDPALRGGAAWVLWEWNGETMTVVDYFLGHNIGVTGLRETLLIDPISRFGPRYATYESNRETSILEHPEVVAAARTSRTQLKGVPTNRMNRGVGELRVSAMSFDMASGLIRFPAATPEDRKRTDLIKTHFINWDSDQAARTAGGRNLRHLEYDIAMAAWVGWVDLKQRVVGDRQDRLVQPRRVSQQAARSWGYSTVLDSKNLRGKVETDLASLYYRGGSS